MNRIAAVLVLAAALPLSAQGPSRTQQQQDATLRINQIQVIGSHNSYHAGLAPSEMKWLGMHNPKAAQSLDYSHHPLDQQLAGGVRQLEIDIFADPQGGRYAHPLITGLTAQAGLPPSPPFDPNHVMDKPGFKVIHTQDLDTRSSCMTLVACLTTVRDWSRAHPGHVPIFLLIETKEGKSEIPGGTTALPFTSQLFDALDAEIRSVFPPSELITPDDVRGHYSTLAAAVHAGGWPTLAQSRGKVLFLMDQAHVTSIYLAGHPDLRGRILFTNSDPTSSTAAFVEQNDNAPAMIDALARQGFLIRTRTDVPTEQARSNDTTRRDAVMVSGAQILSTDYPSFEPSPFSPYVVAFPGGFVARCNPVTAPRTCQDTLIEPTSHALPASALPPVNQMP